MKSFFLFLFPVFFFISCRGDDGIQAESEERQSDSIARKFNSPELKTINDLLRKQPAEASLYYQRGVIYHRLALWKQAENDVRRAIRLDSNKVEYYMKLTDVYFSSNQTRKSKEVLEKVIQMFPEHTDAYMKLGELYFIVRQYKQAAEMVNSALRLESDRADAYFLRGNIYREWGDTSRAISSFQTVVELDPGHEDAWYDLGLLFFFRNQQLCLDYFKKALSLKASARNLYAYAQAHQKFGNYEEALRWYDTLLHKYPEDANALFAKGAIYADIYKRYTDAEKIFEKILTQDSSYISARLAKAVCMEKTGRKHAAREEYKKVLKLQPDNARALEALNKLP